GPAGTVVLRVRVLRGLGLLGLRDRVLVLGGLGGGRLGLLLRLTGLIGGLGGAVGVWPRGILRARDLGAGVP
ncbi:hypothetical protein R0K18_35395, partial [Pantoea sp. SIMBA_133]